jgi:hypothetical protein
MEILQPYLGRRSNHQPYAECRWYGQDNEENCQRHKQTVEPSSIPPEDCLEGEWIYKFNSLGYRGEEYDPDADLSIFVIGCSNTLGTGIRMEQTWGYQFTQLLSSYLGKRRPNYLNFSQGGASNDYITRTILSQVSRVQPDLVLVQFTFAARAEYLRGKEIDYFNPSLTFDDPRMLAMLELHNDEMALYRSLKNMLLIQLQCQNLGVPYLFCARFWEELYGEVESPYLQQLLEQIDSRYVAPFFLNPSIDFARDLSHPGPVTNRTFARRLFEFLLEVYPEEEVERIASRRCPIRNFEESALRLIG